MEKQVDGKKLELEECIGKFTCQIKLSNDGVNDQYMCETCNKHTSAVKSVNFLHLPKTLIIHLKKFTYSAEEEQAVKINPEVSYPTKNLMIGQDKFDLFAVLVQFSLLSVTKALQMMVTTTLM